MNIGRGRSSPSRVGMAAGQRRTGKRMTSEGLAAFSVEGCQGPHRAHRAEAPSSSSMIVTLPHAHGFRGLVPGGLGDGSGVLGSPYADGFRMASK